MKAIQVLVCGAAGRMGREVVRAVASQPDMKLVGAVDVTEAGRDIGELAGAGPPGVTVQDDLASALDAAKPEVMVDFTLPGAVMGNLRTAIGRKVACVAGTTGFTQEDLDVVYGLCKAHKTPCLIAPNFAIGAVLMMQFAAEAARHFDAAEIIELHHDQKKDAPSGTSRRTAEMMLRAKDGRLGGPAKDEESPSRGLGEGKIRIHAVRLPGLVAHQEVIFGGLGETLTIRHDSISRESFMPGVLLAIRKVRALSGLTVGLEKIL